MPGSSRNIIEQKADNILRSMLFDNHKNNFNYLVMFCHNAFYFILITKNNQNMQVSIVLDSQDRQMPATNELKWLLSLQAL